MKGYWGCRDELPAGFSGDTLFVCTDARLPCAGTCDAAAPESLNWSGVASGGWVSSWAQWINSGRGGAVCTRMLVYSTSQSRWIVG